MNTKYRMALALVVLLVMLTPVAGCTKTVTGPAGLGISSARIDTDGHLILNLTDGQKLDLGTVAGSTGAPGATGPQGATGSPGPTGATGPAGVQGPAGPAGTNGANAVNGTNGISISGATVNGFGHLILTLSSNQTVDCGVVIGEAGASGPQGPAGPAGPAGASLNPMDIALLRWWNANTTGISYAVPQALGVCFDGANIWVTSNTDKKVYKLRAIDGSVVGIYSTGDYPLDVCFDGSNIWTANYNSVSKLRASDGALLGNYPGFADDMRSICFDGTNIWAISIGGTLYKLRPGDGSVLATFTVVGGSLGICCDGGNIWVASGSGANSKVVKLRASDGAVLGSYNQALNSSPTAICFDGANVWVVSPDTNTVTKRRASDGLVLGTYNVTGSYADCVGFDGTSIWVGSYSGDVTKLLAKDGSLIGHYTVAGGAYDICFDGANIWVASWDGAVTKL